jgi:hypothetical protein
VALALRANVALVSSLALVPPFAFAGLATASLLGCGLPATAVQRRQVSEEDASAGPAPTISFATRPLVSVGHRRALAGVVLEPCCRAPGGRPVGAEAVDWERMPPRLLVRLETTLLDRAATLAERYREAGRREAVMINVSPGSLADRTFAAGLAAVARLPRAWRDHVGLHLLEPPADEAAVSACLGADLGCLEIDAGRLAQDAEGAGRLVRLAAGFADSSVPVVVAGVTDEAPLARLQGLRTLFARGPLFDGLPALAA